MPLRPIVAFACVSLLVGDWATVSARPIARPSAKVAAAPRLTTPSGLTYRIVRKGPKSGAMARDGDEVTFDYEGKLADGTVFDSSFARGQPISGTVGQFVTGFNEALKLMRPGDEYVVWIPPALGYGSKAVGPIPANSTLRFRMALRSVTRSTP